MFVIILYLGCILEKKSQNEMGIPFSKFMIIFIVAHAHSSSSYLYTK